MIPFRLIVQPNGETRTPGIDFGTYSPEILHRAKGYAVIRVKGSNQWCSVGQTAYYPTQYALVRIKGKKGEYFVEPISEHTPGRKWRKLLTKLIEECNDKAAKEKKGNRHG